jgi:hypothetical protein
VINVRVLQRWWFAWNLLTLAFALHFIDEALHDFLSIYNLVAGKLRDYLPSIPWPTVTFTTWMTIVVTAIAVLFALSIFILRGVSWMRPISYVYAVVMLANGLLHIAVSIYTASLMPGVLSSPLLLAAAIYLLFSIPRHAQTTEQIP